MYSLKKNSLLFILIASLLLGACSQKEDTKPASLEQSLQSVIAQHGLKAIEPAPTSSQALFDLGQALYFDPILSGNKDISCATCHHPSLATGDALALPIGTGGSGLGTSRKLGFGRERVPRNAPELFNRASSQWHTFMWDGRIATSYNGFATPAKEQLPSGLNNLLAAQAMFPVTSRDEMRGNVGDYDSLGQINELALLADNDFTGIWAALMVRLMNLQAYRDMFAAAYPYLSPSELGFQHAANAIAAFEAQAFTLSDSPWDSYLAGNSSALSDDAKLGASLFYGKAQCSVCHSGTLMTDQAFHNILSPQLGPGKGVDAPLDIGRARQSLNPNERFAFRTPPLRNVAATGPWMHNGAYSSLEDTLRHHLGAKEALLNFDKAGLEPSLQPRLHADESTLSSLLSTVDPLCDDILALDDNEISQLLSFLNALTSPSLSELGRFTPSSVPSGLFMQ